MKRKVDIVQIDQWLRRNSAAIVISIFSLLPMTLAMQYQHGFAFQRLGVALRMNELGAVSRTAHLPPQSQTAYSVSRGVVPLPPIALNTAGMMQDNEATGTALGNPSDGGLDDPISDVDSPQNVMPLPPQMLQLN